MEVTELPAQAATVTFNIASTPQVTQLGSTIFAFIAAYTFDGFQPPVDKDAVNVGKAGRRVPLKCRLLDLGGTPVTNLTTGAVKVSSVNVDCGSLSGDSCAGDVYATGACGQTW